MTSPPHLSAKFMYSPIQKKIYKVSDHRFHLLHSPPILAGWRNAGEMKKETL